MTYRKKLIEVALPLEEINKQSAREKSIRHGHPSTLHLWWARRPLAACRAVLFASLVDDPGEYLPEEEARAERERLFRLIEQLVNWDNIQNENILGQARLEIAKSVARDLGEDVPVGEAAIRQFLAEKAPPVLDPFCGGGSIPLEAQRLGLRAYASDLNPVAVLITKALIEIPPKFVNQPPIHPPEEGDDQSSFMEREWKGAQGLAEDVRYYGKRLRDIVEHHTGHLYPKVTITPELLESRSDLHDLGLKNGDKVPVVAWLWARSITCPNPACGSKMPLISTLWLSKKKQKKTWVEPLVNQESRSYSFRVITGKGGPRNAPKIGRGAKFRCLVCDEPAAEENIRAEFQANKNGHVLVAIVVYVGNTRTYLSPNKRQEEIASSALPKWLPEEMMNQNTPNIVSGRGYGFTRWHELFTKRQLLVITTFIDELEDVRSKLISDINQTGSGIRFFKESIDKSSTAYANAVISYLGLAISKLADYNSSFVIWSPSRDQAKSTFARQAIPMVWDFAEVNPFARAAGDIEVTIAGIAKTIERLPTHFPKAEVVQLNATDIKTDEKVVVSTDPPYYDNIAYADLSDYFYIWLRKSLRGIYPELFNTLLTPKADELVAASDRFDGDSKRAKGYFEDGLKEFFSKIPSIQHGNYPLTIYYAYKQQEFIKHGLHVEGDRQFTSSTGWETMLEALISSGFAISGTWPIRTERTSRSISLAANALASSIILVCRKRDKEAKVTTRREFLSTLKTELPQSLKFLQYSSIAPVDLAQATIGPGMRIFSKYRKVLEADGSAMPVRMALALINQVLDECLAEQEGDFDPDTRWAVAWFEQYGHKEGPFGDAETLSKAKNTSADGLVRAGILEARAGKVRLLERNELDQNWDPSEDKRLTTWEAVQYLILAVEESGEEKAAFLLDRLGGLGQAARELAYRLYGICERKGWAQEAIAYNMLATAWPRLIELGQHEPGLAQDQLL